MPIPVSHILLVKYKDTVSRSAREELVAGFLALADQCLLDGQRYMYVKIPQSALSACIRLITSSPRYSEHCAR